MEISLLVLKICIYLDFDSLQIKIKQQKKICVRVEKRKKMIFQHDLFIDRIDVCSKNMLVMRKYFPHLLKIDSHRWCD